MLLINARCDSSIFACDQIGRLTDKNQCLTAKMDKTRQAKEKAKIRLTKQTVSTKRDKNGNFLVYSADSNDAKQKSTNKFNSALVRSTKITYANLSEKNVLLTKTQPKHDFVEITRSLLGLGGSEIKS